MNKVIKNSIKFLAKNQQKDGSFLSFTSPDSKHFKKSVKCESVFSTALILSALNSLKEEDSQLEDVKKRTVRFLLAQKSEHCTFNYWARNSKQSKEMSYPDDLDDTSCALSALYEYDPKLIDGEIMAHVVNVLTFLEEKEGGPYKTWLVSANDKDIWKDIDLVVNSNIGYFLSLQDVKLKNIEKLIEKAIDNKNYTSPYYPSIYPVIYFISRFYKGKKSKDIISFLFDKQDGDNWGSSLNTALAVLSLLNFGVEFSVLEKNINYILKNIKKNNSWDIDVFYAGINPKQKKGDKNKYYAGSECLSTAYCIEALNRFSEFKEKNKQIKNIDLDEEEIYKEVVKRAKKIFSSLDDDLKKESLSILNKTIKGDKDKQIVLIAYYFYKSLNKNSEFENHRSKIIDLGLANLFGWIAYTIYDDFLDEEGNPKLISVANVSIRESDRIFLNILPNSDFSDFVKEVFNRIDGANSWELKNCRLKEKNISSALGCVMPSFDNIKYISDRSLGHVLGPIGVLSLLGYKINSKECSNVLEGFRCYISARQMLDDMHDWEEDISRGQINSASSKLISSIKNKKIINKSDTEILQFLQKYFWNNTVTQLCRKSDAYIKQSEKLFLASGVSQVFIDQILKPLHFTIKKTIEERDSAKKFMVTYIKNSK